MELAGPGFYMPISKLNDLHSAFSDPIGTFGG